MRDSIHRRKPINLIVLMSLLVSFVLPFASARPSVVEAAPGTMTSRGTLAQQTPATLNAPTSVTLTGNLQSELGCTDDWDAACATTHLTQIGNGVWRGQFTVPNGSWEYKMVIDNAWANGSYSGNHVIGPDSNTTLNLAVPTLVTFYFDDKTKAVLDSVMDDVAVAAGSFQSELGCTADNAPACVRSLLTDVDGDDTYEFSSSAIPEGTYTFKVALNESGTPSYPATDLPFTVGVGGGNVKITWNSTSNAVTVVVTALGESLRHDSRSDVYRTPYGAVPVNTPVTLR
nr:hypothetical protein [Herpetosiphonaceae bacterium]